MITSLVVGGSALAVVLSQKFTREWWFKRHTLDREKIDHYPEAAFLVPVDGTIVYIKDVHEGKLTTEKKGTMIAEDWVEGQSGILVGIYMGIYDRHFIVNPLGDFLSVRHEKTTGNIPMMDVWEYINFYYFGRLVDWFEEKAFGYKLQNEKVIYDYACGVKLMGIADKFVNKIEIPQELHDGHVYQPRGQKIGYIKRGSQVDVFIPTHLFDQLTHIKVGTTVKAGNALCRMNLHDIPY